MRWSLVLIGVAAFAYALAERFLSRHYLSGPMVFVAFGFVVGPEMLDVVEFSLQGSGELVAVNVTLGLTLFLDGLTLDYDELRSAPGLPLRLLGLGLPLTILLGALGASLLFPVFEGWEVLAVAAVLAPTDAVLGQAMVANPVVPSRVRRALSVESGLNDGIALAVLTVVVRLGEDVADAGTVPVVLETIFEEIVVGVLAGVLVGLGAGKVLRRVTGRVAIDNAWLAVSVATVALVAYGLAVPFHGSGFVAVYVAGVATARAAEGTVGPEALEIDEAIVKMLTMLVFAVFGATLLSPALGNLTPAIVCYVAASLTVVRMAPVALCLLGSGEDWRSRLVMGWSGPRGLASILFLFVVLGQPASQVQGLTTLYTVGVWTIAASVFAHGLTSAPLSRWFGRAEARRLAAERAS